MANLVDRVMKKFMKHLDLTPNQTESEARRANAKVAGSRTARAPGLHGGTAGKAGRPTRGNGGHQAHSRLSGLFHRGH
jgi:hypothetical protein